jgi:hypothetical protein
LVAASLASAPTLQAQRRTEPDSVRLITSDIQRFWNAFDAASRSGDFDGRLRADYLDAGSAGLRAFARREIGDPGDFAGAVATHRPMYDSVRPSTLRVADAEATIRAALRRLKSIYADAIFLDVYFVIGRFSIGGWTRGDTMVIGAEMYATPSLLAPIVAHELIHRQQAPPSDDQTLLERAFNEGSADFVGELISGATINPGPQQYGRAHEHELWVDFERVMTSREYLPWMYVAPIDGRPRDLGYFFGYRIAQAYYDRATDKRAALRDILRADDVNALLARSGYSP